MLLLLIVIIFAGVECSDEISTGLDAATTFDICKILKETTRIRHTLRIVSLLQPPPETVALFDEVILLGEGRILYAGPVDEVTQHFKSLGYVQPERMDPADWLQVSICLCFSARCNEQALYSYIFRSWPIMCVVSPNKGWRKISSKSRRNGSFNK